MNYWIIVDNKPAGPYTGEQLVEAGLRPDTLVWRKGYAQWIESAHVPELAGMMARRDMSAPVTPPPHAAQAPAGNAQADTEPQITETHVETPSYEEEITDVKVAEAREELSSDSDNAEVTADVVTEPAETASQPAAAMEEPEPRHWEPSAVDDAETPASSQSADIPVADAVQEPVPPCPPAYVAWSVIVTVLCCVPVGVAALILSSMTKSAYYKGNLEKAMKYSEITQWLIIAAIVCGTALAPFQMVFTSMF